MIVLKRKYHIIDHQKIYKWVVQDVDYALSPAKEWPKKSNQKGVPR